MVGDNNSHSHVARCVVSQHPGSRDVSLLPTGDPQTKDRPCSLGLAGLVGSGLPQTSFQSQDKWIQLSGVRALENPVFSGFHQHFSEGTDLEMLPENSDTRPPPGPAEFGIFRECGPGFCT